MSSSGQSAYTLGAQDMDGMSNTSGASVEVNPRPLAANSGGPGLYGPERRPRSSSPRADPTLKVPAVLNVRPVSALAAPLSSIVGPSLSNNMGPPAESAEGAKGCGDGNSSASTAVNRSTPAAGVVGDAEGAVGEIADSTGAKPATGGGLRGSGTADGSASTAGPVPVPEGQGAVGGRDPRL